MKLYTDSYFFARLRLTSACCDLTRAGRSRLRFVIRQTESGGLEVFEGGGRRLVALLSGDLLYHLSLKHHAALETHRRQKDRDALMLFDRALENTYEVS